MIRPLLAAVLWASTLLAAAPTAVQAQQAVVNLYSSRHYDSDEEIFRRFTAATGITVRRIDGEGDPLIERLRAEGANSPADLLLTVDAGRLERARQLDLLQPVPLSPALAAIPAHLRDPDNHWFGLSMRARVIVYDRGRVDPATLPRYESLADPQWRGQICTRSSTNIYNQSLAGSLLAALGPERTEEWARGLVANLARPPRGGDTDQIRAVAAGECSIALSNTYYFANLLRSEPALAERVGVIFPNQADRGTHVNISGAGVARHAPNRDNAVRFLDFLASPEIQALFAGQNSEYPVIVGVPLPASVAGLGEFRQDSLNAGVFARNNAEALQLMDRAGWR